jgi:hypothetical protein
MPVSTTDLMLPALNSLQVQPRHAAKQAWKKKPLIEEIVRF